MVSVKYGLILTMQKTKIMYGNIKQDSENSIYQLRDMTFVWNTRTYIKKTHCEEFHR